MGFVGSSGGTDATVKRAAFTSKEFGVGVSPRMSTAENPPRGGGRYLVGKPYQVRGTWFTPKEDPGYHAAGHASWYGADFHGRMTANGEIFSKNAITAAHPTLPLPSYVRVTNKANGRSLVVRVNDRGPFLQDRVIDLSYRAASLLDYVNSGTADVVVQYVGPAPLEGDDTRTLMASLEAPNGFDTNSSEVRVASVDQSSGNTVFGAVSNAFGNLFGYADTDVPISSAHAAAEAMATRAPQGLEDWRDSVDEEARAITLRLGVFSNPDNADAVERAFALLGAVDHEDVSVAGKPAARLTLTHLKPGVARADVLALARELGLSDIILY